jgi:hypothetical protein
MIVYLYLMWTKNVNKCCSVFYSHQTRGSCNVILFRLVGVQFQPSAQIQMSSQLIGFLSICSFEFPTPNTEKRIKKRFGVSDLIVI